MGLKDLQIFAEQEAQFAGQTNTLGQSLDRGFDQNPDEYAELLKISAKTGIAPELAKDYKPELVKQDKINSLSLDNIVRTHPKTTMFLSDPDNAAIAQDDIENMTFMETVFQKAKDYGGALGSGVVGKTGGSLLSGAGELYGVASRNLESLLDKVLPNSVMSALRTPIPWFLDPEQVLKRPGTTLKAAGEYMAPIKERQGLDTDVVEGIGQLGGQIAVFLASGGTITAGAMYAQGADVMAEKTKDDKADPALRDTAIVAGGAITALTEKYGLDKILNRVPPTIKNRALRFIADKFAAGGIEAAQEVTEGLLHDLTRRVLTDENAPILEGALREGSAAGLSAAIVRAALGVRPYRQAKMQEEMVKAMAGDSKLRDRLPEKYQQFIASVSQDGPVQNAFIPVEQFTTFFQSQNMDPEQMAESFGATNYREALAAGSEVVIPIDQFAAKVAPTDYLQGLMADIKFDQNAMTAREREIAMANLDQQERDILANMEQIVAEQQKQGGINAAIEAVVKDIEGQLVSIGTDARTARDQATTLRGVAVLVERDLRGRAQAEGRELTDQDVFDAVSQVWDRYGLTVTRQIPEILTTAPTSNVNIDPLLDALRGNDFPTDAQIYGKSLAEFIRDSGGLVAMGETLTADENMERRPFQAKLVQPTGMTIEQALERAVQAGYFPGSMPGDLTEADFLNALDDDLRGGGVYSPMQGDTDLLARKEGLNSLYDYLTSIGVDLNTMNNAQVRQAMDLARQTPEGEMAATQVQEAMSRLFQVRLPETIDVDGVQRPTTNSEGRQIHQTEEGVRKFWRWFGDSKVVDADGKPLVVYHATNNNFSTFRQSFRGAIFVTPDAEFANDFLDNSGSTYLEEGANVMPVYVRAENPFDYENPQHVAQIIEYLQTTGLFRGVQPGFFEGGRWDSIEDRAVQKAIKALGFDSFYVQEGGVKNLGLYDPNQIKSATGNQGTFDPTSDNILYQQTAKRDDYTLDMFGVPTDTGADAPAEKSAAGRRGRRLSRDDAPGRYATRTEIVQENTRTLGTDRVTTPAEAAQAMAYLGRGAVERFDALITDADGTPLAVVGAFKGAISQASVYPATIAAEAFRIEGAANIWFAHNHPSGNPTLSAADINLNAALANVFRGSEIATHGILAIAGRDGDGRKWTFESDGGGSDSSGTTTKPAAETQIPVVERVFTQDEKLGSPIVGPNDAKNAAKNMSGGGSGVLLLDAQNAPVAFVPVDPQAAGELRTGGRMDALWRALSMSNAGAVIIVNNSAYANDQVRNLAGFFQTADVRALDVMDTSGDSVVSYAEQGLSFQASTFRQGQNMDDKRGFIQFGPSRKFNITLLEKANRSTFLHEVGHFYLEVMGDLATAPGASEAITQDYAKVLKFLGLESREQLTLDGKDPNSAEFKRAVEAHEKWARANEAYLMEGNAPTPELQDVFQRFKAWMTLIYKALTSLNVQLTNEVREVFDRIYATDLEIQAAKAQVNVEALFLDAKAAGMSQQEFELYRQSVAQATESAKESLTAKLMRELQRERETWWKERRDEMRKEVEVEVDSQQVYQAFKALVAGKMDDDTNIKLNKQSLVDKYGIEYVKRLPRGFQRIYTTQGGMDADTAAEFLGYNSGDALLEAIVGMRDRKELIEAETDQRMRDTYGDMLNDGSIADEAKIALHNKHRENLLVAELRALRRKQREVAPFVQAERQAQREDRRQARAATQTPPVEAFRRAAKGIIGQTAVRDIRPNTYLLASRKAARQAFDAMAKGDYMLAADAKQKEILNHFLYIEANKARQEADKILKYAQKFEKGTTREAMGKAGGTYLEQIDALLDRYEFRRVPLSKIDRRQSLSDWIAEQEAAGAEPSIDPVLLNESRLVNYKQASMDELRAVYDAVRNIEHMARYKNKLLAKQKDIQFADAIAELVAAAENMTAGKGDKAKGTRKPLPLDMSAMTMREKAGDTVSRFDAMLLKMEQVVEWLDNGDVNGPWHTYLWNPISEAQNKEYDITRQLTEKLAASLEKMPKEQRMSMLDTYEIPGMGKVTRKFLISVALNMGNQGNIDKMMRGMGWDIATIERGLAKLNDADWTFVQETWDTINSIWPQIAELEKRMTGLEPPKVEAQPYEVRDEQGNVIRTLPGGYYPLVYDPRKSEQGAKQEAGNLGQLFEEGYVRATTPKGHTQARMEGFAAPILLDFEQVVTQHLAKVVKDLTHREAVVQANKILTNREIRSVLQETLGPAYEKQMLPWLRSVVNDRNGGSVQGLTDFSRWMMTARANVVAAVMGFKATTMIAQITGLSQSLDKVQGKYLSQALLEYLRHPIQATRYVRELSGEMRNRANTLDRDIRDQLRNLTGQNSTYAQAQRFAFHGIAIVDSMVTVPTWLGAYRQALAEGKSEETARLEADAAVRMTQGAGGAKDLSAIQRNNELSKTLTMFYSYFNVLYNRMRDMGRDVQEIRDMPRFLSRVFFTVMVPAVLGELILGRGPDEDEDPAAWTIRKVLLYPFMSIPVLRDVVSSIDSGYDYRFSPMATVFEKIGKAATSTGKVIQGDMEWGDYSLRVAETIGYVFGIGGTGQLSATGKYLWRVSEGEENPDNIAELLAYALLGKRKED